MSEFSDSSLTPKPYVPTLTYPNGGEFITSRQITVTWHAPNPESPDGSAVWYELYFTDNYDANGRPDWRMVSHIPASASSFLYTFSGSAASDRCRFGISARTASGRTTEMSISAANFTVAKRKLPSPSLQSPSDGGAYRAYVPIVFNHEGVTGFGRRATYQIAYSSESLGLDWTPLYSDLSTSTHPLFWDVRELDEANDYALRVVLLDDDGGSSVPMFVRNLKLAPMHSFILDTTPPKGAIAIANNVDITNKRDTVVLLTAFDEATETTTVTLRQRDGETIVSGPQQDFSAAKTWHLEGEDGVKIVEAVFGDAAGNLADENQVAAFFRTYLDDSNNPVTALFVESGPNGDVEEDVVWTGIGGDDPSLYRNLEQYASLTEQPTAIISYKSIVYVATRSEEGKGTLRRASGGVLQTINEFSSTDSAVSSMAVFNNKLYIGMENGDLYSFDGTSFSLVNSFSRRISHLASTAAALYVFVDHDSPRYYDGTSFSTAEFLDGDHQV